VQARIEEGVDLSAIVPGDQDWVLAHVRSEEVPFVGDLTFVAQKQPASSEDSFKFQIINALIGEDAPTDAAAFILNQALKVLDQQTTSLAKISHSDSQSGDSSTLPG
jgi:hypothetical protein